MYRIEKASQEDYTTLSTIWESAVKVTHHFLKKEDFELIKAALVTQYFPLVDLFSAKDEEDVIVAFMGIFQNKLEMLFVDADMRGKGVGKMLLNYSIENLNVTRVDVNEQNEQAVGFYQKFGFKTINRNELDGQGKPYPILEMSL